jgi:hypothetical protein
VIGPSVSKIIHAVYIVIELNQFVFSVSISRSLFSDLLGYWQHLNMESSAFGKIYMDAIRKQEGMDFVMPAWLGC